MQCCDGMMIWMLDGFIKTWYVASKVATLEPLVTTCYDKRAWRADRGGRTWTDLAGRTRRGLRVMGDGWFGRFSKTVGQNHSSKTHYFDLSNPNSQQQLIFAY